MPQAAGGVNPTQPLAMAHKESDAEARQRRGSRRLAGARRHGRGAGAPTTVRHAVMLLGGLRGRQRPRISAALCLCCTYFQNCPISAIYCLI